MIIFTHFYRNSLFTRVSINLVIFLVVHLTLILPLRTFVNEKLVYPSLYEVFKNYADVFIPDPKQPWSVGWRFQNSDKVVQAIIPFGAFWGIPITLFASIRSWGLMKKLTYYHVLITFLLPILLSLFFLRWVWSFVPTDIFLYLSRFLGMSFCVFALKGLYNEHCRTRKAMGVDEGIK